jgi:hypothetical protein
MPSTLRPACSEEGYLRRDDVYDVRVSTERRR